MSELVPRPRPIAAYRLQLTPDWTLDDAAQLVPYLADLGVSHVYTSPVLEAEEGSQHGYDVVDHGQVRAELGGEAALERFVTAVRDAGLHWLLDIVPNHVSVATPHRNRWWWATLQGGRSARESQAFDITWDVAGDRLVLPILGAPLDEVLAEGHIGVGERDGEPVVTLYGETDLPIRPELASDAVALRGDQPDPGALRRLLDGQHYRLDHWREPTRNYRCFFDISDLAALRVEQDWVFEVSHRRIDEWTRAGWLAGVRVDHVDGLLDPTAYLQQLRELIGDGWILVEKILTPGERMPATWPVDGTTGYEFARLTAGALVSHRGIAGLDSLYAELTGHHADYADIEHHAKREAVERRLGADLAVLDRLAADALGSKAPSRTLRRRALTELLASFSVYRTYLGDQVADEAGGPAADGEPGRDDRELVGEAVERAEANVPDAAPVVGQLAQVMLDPTDEAQKRFQDRLQQVSGPVMAKGGEDTALYRYHRLLALNDVGFAPDLVPDPATFHWELAELQADHPFSMVTTSTHDTKRSEDVRARLGLLSEMADRWGDVARRWLKLTEDTGVDNPVRYLALQTAVGAWPIDAGRLSEYLVKATREGGERTSWVDPDADYEAALGRLSEALTAGDGLGAEVAELVDELARPWAANVLAQTILRLTAGGVPDTYRGTELVDLSLVDPDNRRPVDWEQRRRLLDGVQDDDLLRSWADGDLDRSKLLTTARLLQLRQQRPDAFGEEAAHVRLEVRGTNADRVMAYRRGEDVVVLVSRLPVETDAAGWATTTVDLPEGTWRPVLSSDGPFVVGSDPQPLDALLNPVPHRVLVRT